jgi:hypothetical protein
MSHKSESWQTRYFLKLLNFIVSRYLILNFLFLLVGIGSWMFHMSLRFYMLPDP